MNASYPLSAVWGKWHQRCVSSTKQRLPENALTRCLHISGRLGYHYGFTIYPLPLLPPWTPPAPPCPTALGSIDGLPPYPSTQTPMMVPYPIRCQVFVGGDRLGVWGVVLVVCVCVGCVALCRCVCVCDLLIFLPICTSSCAPLVFLSRQRAPFALRWPASLPPYPPTRTPTMVPYPIPHIYELLSSRRPPPVFLRIPSGSLGIPQTGVPDSARLDACASHQRVCVPLVLSSSFPFVLGSARCSLHDGRSAAKEALLPYHPYVRARTPLLSCCSRQRAPYPPPFGLF